VALQDKVYGSVEALQEELRNRTRVGRSASAAYDSESDDEGGRGGQRVQCAQQ
jgi:hypothetical protein